MTPLTSANHPPAMLSSFSIQLAFSQIVSVKRIFFRDDIFNVIDYYRFTEDE